MIMHAGGKQNCNVPCCILLMLLVLYFANLHILYSSICFSIKCIPNKTKG